MAQTEHSKSHLIELEDGTSFSCGADERVLHAMERAMLTGIQVGCRGGGCGACRVQVLSGEYQSLKMSKIHVDDAEAAQGFALACRILPKSDLKLRIALKETQVIEPSPQAVAVNG